MPAFLKIDFKKYPKEYLVAAMNYAFEGNIPAFGGGPVAWDPFANKVREWYHIPWLHPPSPSGFPPNGGTEGFRGLITEINLTPKQLGPNQTEQYTMYAITLVNEYAGYSLGRMWKDPDNPDPSAMDVRYGGGFIPGTVFAKLLLADAPGEKVPYLRNPMQWQAYIQKSFGSKERHVAGVNLTQMDIAVRDPRADGPNMTGWVFGTLVYNGAVNNKKSQFLNLVPLGVILGNDPENTANKVNPFPPKPVTKIINKNLKQTVIFASELLPPQHLGWNSRLCGPADLNTSSCLSCHMAAQYPPIRNMFPPNATPGGLPTPPKGGGSKLWMEWFQNRLCGTTMNPKTTYSTDFSLQVAISLENFYANKSKQLQGEWAEDFELDRTPISRGDRGDR